MGLLENITKLAEENPEVRKTLVPFLKHAACGEKWKNEDGTFKGKPGEAFDNCKKFMTECRDDVDDPEALCAWIGRKHGKIGAGLGPVKKYVTVELTGVGMRVFFHFLYQPVIGLDFLHMNVKDQVVDAESAMKNFFAEIGEGGRSMGIRFDPYVEKAKEGNYLHVSGISGFVKYPKGWLDDLGVADAESFKKMIEPVVGAQWFVREVTLSR